MNRFQHEERGQTLVMAVMFMTVLLGMTALVLDVGSWYRTQRAAQAAADAAALAGAQTLPQDTGTAATVATAKVGENGSQPAPSGPITFSDGNATIDVKVVRPTDAFFSRIFGIGGPTVHAEAAAHTFVPGKAKYVAPIAVNINHPMLEGTPGCPCYGPANQTSIPLGKVPTGTKADKNIPGAFILIDLDRTDGGNSGSSTLADWITHGFGDYLPLADYNSDTGAKFNSSSIQDALGQRLDTDLLFPIYDSVSGTGSNAEYNIVAWAVFHLTYVQPGDGNSGELDGYFQQTIWEGLEPTGGNSSPDLGVHSIELVK